MVGVLGVVGGAVRFPQLIGPHHVAAAAPKAHGSPMLTFAYLFGFVSLLIALVTYIGNGGKMRKDPVGSGRVVLVVGRMGSGKSMYAVRTVSRWVRRGGYAMTNFSLKWDRLCKTAGCDHSGCVAADCRSRWQRFRGWDQLMEAENCLIVIDEAHLYAPSNKTIDFPDDVRWKISMLRKYHCDLFLVTQHESRINSVLRTLLNYVYVCTAWAGGAVFTLKGYEPENVRKPKKHLERKFYRLDAKVAGLYDTLEILESDGVHVGAGTRIAELAAARNALRVAADKAAERGAAGGPAGRAEDPPSGGEDGSGPGASPRRSGPPLRFVRGRGVRS